MFSSEGSLEYARVVAKSWTDPAFRERLIADPRTVLGQFGIAVPHDVLISVNPDAETTRVELALPPMPAMTDEALTRIADVCQSAAGQKTGKTKGGGAVSDETPGRSGKTRGGGAVSDETPGGCGKTKGGGAVPDETPGRSGKTRGGGPAY